MSWTTSDGTHEGYAAHITMDGREAVSTSRDGMHLDHSDEFIDGRWTAAVPWDQLLGWEARCTCGWVGPLWRRPAGADLQDAEEYDLGDGGGPITSVGFRTADDEIRAAWLTHLARYAARTNRVLEQVL